MKWTVELADMPDRENEVAELWLGDVMVAEVNTESGKPKLEIYPQRTGEPWSFDVDDFLDALLKAKRRLGIVGSN